MQQGWVSSISLTLIKSCPARHKLKKMVTDWRYSTQQSQKLFVGCKTYFVKESVASSYLS